MILCNSISRRFDKFLTASSCQQNSPHDIQEPLLEEYSVAAHVGLSNPVHSPPHYADYADLSRARSARHSSFFGVSIHQMLLTQIYKFPQSSLAELARNSVIQSGFEMEIKRHWLGQYWYLPGDAGNEINKVRVASWKATRDAMPFRHPLSVFCVYSDR